ncbi:NTP transferase domain-containing protein [bacterium]|nr:NTP transferase domain-containing protein [bacterium]
MTTRPVMAVILAAGKGTRMKSDKAKVLHTILGKPLVGYVIDACRKGGVDRIMLVIGHQADLVRSVIGDGVEYALQERQLGTGHALLTAAETAGAYSGDVLVLVGDAPFLTGEILARLIERHRDTNAAATMMTAVIDPPPAYGRIIRDNRGRVVRIVEDRDATEAEKRITEVNTSHYCFDADRVFPLLSALSTDNDQGEYYLTDIIELLTARGQLIETLTVDDPDVLKGINTVAELKAAEDLLRRRRRA